MLNGTGSIPSLHAILFERVHIALLTALSRIIAQGATSASSSTAVAPLFDAKYNKLVITLVRSIKNIYLDLANVTISSLLGTFATPSAIHSGGEIVAPDGKLLYSWEAGGFTALASSALDYLFQSSPSSPYQPFIPSLENIPSSLDSILLLLIDSRARPGPADLQQTQISEMICTLFAEVIRTTQQRLAIQSFLCVREGRHATGALLSLIRWRTGKVCLAMFMTL